MVCPKYSHVRTSSDCRQDWVCLVEREDNVIMEHLGRWKQSKRKINQSSDSGESLLEYEDFVIHEYIMVCGEKNWAVWASSDNLHPHLSIGRTHVYS